LLVDVVCMRASQPLSEAHQESPSECAARIQSARVRKLRAVKTKGRRVGVESVRDPFETTSAKPVVAAAAQSHRWRAKARVET
jgi:hypothetical protein